MMIRWVFGIAAVAEVLGAIRHTEASLHGPASQG